MKVKIMHIVQCAGGVDCYLRMLLAHMNRSSFEHILVCSFDYNKEDYEHIVDTFIQVDMCNTLSLEKDRYATIKVRGLIREYRPDAIYCHSSKAGGIGRIANIGLGTPIVYNPHGWAFNMNSSWTKKELYLWIERILALFTTKLVAISNYEKLSAIENRVTSAKKIKVIFNGIDVENINSQLFENGITRELLGIRKDAYVIGMVGRISAQKSPDVFVRAAAKIRDSIPESHFIIVGDGDQRSEIEGLINEIGLKQSVTITGWVDNPLPYTMLFDQALLLSRWEGFGLVLAEYMKLGKPVVATEINAIPDLITDHDNGLLVEVDNVQQIVDAVLNIYHDKELRNKLVSNGMKRVDAFFDVKRVASEHEQLFMHLCKKDRD